VLGRGRREHRDPKGGQAGQTGEDVVAVSLERLVGEQEQGGRTQHADEHITDAGVVVGGERATGEVGGPLQPKVAEHDQYRQGQAQDPDRRPQK
jgi:hypothetical protein